jgi:hypothetical protein
MFPDDACKSNLVISRLYVHKRVNYIAYHLFFNRLSHGSRRTIVALCNIFVRRKPDLERRKK